MRARLSFRKDDVVYVVCGILLAISLSLFFHARGLTLAFWKCREQIAVSPYRYDKEYRGEGEILILDTRGRHVSRIPLQYPALNILPRSDGTFFVALTPWGDPTLDPGGGETGVLQQVDKSGHVLWEYKDAMMHHGFDILPGGDIVYLAWVPANTAFARNIKGGVREPSDKETWVDEVVIIDAAGNKKWSWRFDEHLRASEYTLNSYTPRTEWSHANSVHYVAKNPLTQTPAVLVSARHLNTVFMIEVGSGKILWRSPSKMLSFQHDATLTPDGNILVFDNGFFREQPRPFLWSRVVEIDPETNLIVKEFNGGEGGVRSTFSSSIMSGAERLPNGNTLITLSSQSVIQEVDSEGNVVWELFNRYREDGHARMLMKARSYRSCPSQ